jgi:hypothetical protein
MAKKVKNSEPKAPKEPQATVRGNPVTDTIKKMGDNNEAGGLVPTRMLGKGVSAI